MDKYLRLQTLLAERERNHLYRRARIADSAQQPLMQMNGKTLLNFCSNDYLGLANHPAVISAFQQAANDYGVGSGAAHLINGHSRLHQQLEEALAELTGRERVLLFSTGYMANIGVISALLNRHDTLYQDRLNHASLLDAGRLANAKLVRYAHNDIAHLRQRFKPEGQALIATDGVFSMDGDTAPVNELADFATEYDAWLLIDDAHGFGVLGARGAGLVEEAGLSAQQAILMATLGKALGTAGAFVAGDACLIEYLIQTARSYIYTTAQPPAIAAASLASLNLLSTEAWRREHLRDLISYFRNGATQLALPLMPSHTAIQPLLIGDSAKALAISRQLEQHGFLVPAIRPPTVPTNSARLRITLSAAHTHTQIDQLLAALESHCA